MGQGGLLQRRCYRSAPNRQSFGWGHNERLTGDNGFTFVIGESGIETNAVFFTDDFQKVVYNTRIYYLDENSPEVQHFLTENSRKDQHLLDSQIKLS